MADQKDSSPEDNIIVYQANPLIEGVRDMSADEARIYYYGLSQLNPHLPNAKFYDEEFEPIIVPAAEVIKVFGGNKSYYKRLKNICELLSHRSIGIKDPVTKQFSFKPVFRLLQFTSSGEGLRIHFNVEMKPYLLELADKPFTKIARQEAFLVSSEYSLRLLEMLLQYRNMHGKKRFGNTIQREFTLDEYREKMVVEKYDAKLKRMIQPNERYRTSTNLINRTVKIPVNEINDSGRYRIEYSVIKKGRKIVGLQFTLVDLSGVFDSLDRDNTDTINVTANEIVPSAIMEEVSESEIDLAQQLHLNGVGKTVSKRMATKYSRDRIINNIKYAKKQKGIKNIGAYIRKAIEQDYANNVVEQDLFDLETPAPLVLAPPPVVVELPEYDKEKLNRFLKRFNQLGIGDGSARGILNPCINDNSVSTSTVAKHYCEKYGINADNVDEAWKADNPEIITSSKVIEVENLAANNIEPSADVNSDSKMAVNAPEIHENASNDIGAYESMSDAMEAAMMEKLNPLEQIAIKQLLPLLKAGKLNQADEEKVNKLLLKMI